MIEQHFLSNSFKDYYNLNRLEDVILTCDVDWAPDFAIEHLIDIISEFGFKITIFATHESKLLLECASSSTIEIGLHPDFTRRHHKQGFAEKIYRLKDIYTDSVGMRSHRNFFGQNISDLAASAGLKYDVSTFLWNEAFCQAHLDHNGILKFSYMWEDGIHLDTFTPKEIESINLHSPGLKILNVHPILIYLNSPDEDHRRSVTQRYSDLTKASYEDIHCSVNRKEFGIRDFFISLLSYLKEERVRTHLLQDILRAVPLRYGLLREVDSGG